MNEVEIWQRQLDLEFRNAARRLKNIFGVPNAPDPTGRIKDDLPFGYDSCLFYTPLKDEVDIFVVSSLMEPKNSQRLSWVINEETSHFCHHLVNRVVWDEMGEIEFIHNNGDTGYKHLRLLELTNLTEFVARLGAYYNGVPPMDGDDLITLWRELKAEVAHIKRPQDLEDYCKSKPDYADKLYPIIRRFWGCMLGDSVATTTERDFLPRLELIQGVAKAKSFREAADVFDTEYPRLENQIRKVAEQYFEKKIL